LARIAYTVVLEEELAEIRRDGLKLLNGRRKYIFDSREDCLRNLEIEERQENLALLKMIIPLNIKIHSDTSGRKYVDKTIPKTYITVACTDSLRKSRGERLLSHEALEVSWEY